MVKTLLDFLVAKTQRERRKKLRSKKNKDRFIKSIINN